MKLDIDLAFFCNECGGILVGKWAGRGRAGEELIDIEPCQKCMSDAEREGYKDGLNDGGRNENSIA